MIAKEKIEYRKAYVEIYEIIKNMTLEERKKIPQNIIDNIQIKMDNEYKFVFDINKDILEQNLKVETKAILVEIYEKYIAPESEKNFWKKYDEICLQKIEKQKQEQYGINDIFTNKKEENKVDNVNLPVIIKKENFLIKIFKKIKNIFK